MNRGLLYFLSIPRIGCIKFNGDDACSFCSIQYGGMWKNELPAEEAWLAIRLAWTAGYDYLYVTADELPLTFARTHARHGGVAASMVA